MIHVTDRNRAQRNEMVERTVAMSSWSAYSASVHTNTGQGSAHAPSRTVGHVGLSGFTRGAGQIECTDVTADAIAVAGWSGAVQLEHVEKMSAVK